MLLQSEPTYSKGMTYKYEQQLLLKFGKNVARVRKEKGLTQEQLAESLDVSVVTIAYIETGKRWVRIGTLSKIASKLNVDISILFVGVKK